ncbi:MAG TPA: NAD(P)/FAD-dependent oxidoreductase [Gemmatimonadaceae bacterium]|nr:NAD(P)/FAD-dependent oxidoreductase [Gemmatimonadaceae bacterium]
MPTPDRIPVLVLGAGPAGLATSAMLAHHGLEHAVLERGPRVGWSWANFYDSLVLHTGKHLSALPLAGFPPGTPLFPPRAAFVDYLERYAAGRALPVRTGVTVTRVARDGYGWIVHAEGEEVRAHALVMATGIASSPRMPVLPGRERYGGQVMHSVEYRRPDGMTGRRVLVVGAGNSGAEIASELAHHGAVVEIAVRSGVNVVPRSLAGVPVQYVALALRKLPRPVQVRVAAVVAALGARRNGPGLPRATHGALDAIPVIGFHLVDAVRAGTVTVRPGVTGFTDTGAQFADGTEGAFDTVIMATGFTPALGALGGLVSRDAKGFARRTDRVTSADQPGLFFVGQNYDALGGLRNLAMDARLVGDRLARVRHQIRTLVSGSWKAQTPASKRERGW